MAVTSGELALHIALIVVSAATFFVMLYAVSKLTIGELRRVAVLFLIAFLLSTFRWVGGSLVRLESPVMNVFIVEMLWALSGIIAGLFAIWGAIGLITFSRKMRVSTE